MRLCFCTSRLPLFVTVILLSGVCGIAVLWLTSPAAHAGSAKVKICHIPPSNPATYHTISVSENALNAHLAHGDLPGSCFESCETLCDDGNACTIDACDPETEMCLVDHPPVDCDDGNPCTLDTCDPIGDAGGWRAGCDLGGPVHGHPLALTSLRPSPSRGTYQWSARSAGPDGEEQW